MFSGIIQTKGTVVSRNREKLVVAPEKPLAGLKAGESVCVDGVCLTLDKTGRGKVAFRLAPETIRVSTLGQLRAGAKVSLERALRMNDRVGGHLLLGHVDGKGTITARLPRGRNLTLEVQIPASLGMLLVPKGPIGIDGVSLTLDSSTPPASSGGQVRIRVHLIPFTLRNTTLGSKPVGSQVNIEQDLIAKYVFRMLKWDR